MGILCFIGVIYFLQTLILQLKEMFSLFRVKTTCGRFKHCLHSRSVRGAAVRLRHIFLRVLKTEQVHLLFKQKCSFTFNYAVVYCAPLARESLVFLPHCFHLVGKR